MGFPKGVADRAFAACSRCCCICHKFCGLKMELHHIDTQSEGGDDSFDNCIPLCLECHADMRSYDHKHPKGHTYSRTELREHRDNWYAKVATSGPTLPVSQAPASVVLEARLALATDYRQIQHLGCPALQVTVVCRSVRPAKLADVELRLAGYNPMSEIQKGFDANFGYVPPPPPARAKDYFSVTLIATSPPTCAGGFVLQTDDVAKFLLPYSIPIFPKLLSAKPNKVSLHAIGMDGEAMQLASGKKLIKWLATLDQFAGQQAYTLRIPIRFTANVSTMGSPTLEAVGTANAREIMLEGCAQQKPVDRIQIITHLFWLIFNNWAITKRLEYRIVPSADVDGCTVSQLKALDYWVGVGMHGATLTLTEMVALFRLLADQTAQIADAKGNLKPDASPSFESFVDLHPSDDVVAITVSQLVFSPKEPSRASAGGAK